MAREIEVKLLVDSGSYPEVLDMLKAELLPVASRFEEGTSIDTYWKALPEAPGKFLRLRVNSDESTLTAKTEDRGGIEDRAEHEILVMPSQKEALMDALLATMGEPIPLMWRFADFKLGMSGTTISLIQNLDKPQWVFIEVEAVTIEECTRWVQRLSTLSEYTLRRVKNSFFDIFVMRQGVLL